MDRLGEEDPRLVTLIEMRFFAGMTAEETAEARSESVHAVRHDLRYAQARLRRILESDHASGWAFAFPAVFLIFVFGLVPVVWSALLSFQRTNLIAPGQWIGLANYRALPHDPLFQQSREQPDLRLQELECPL